MTLLQENFATAPTIAAVVRVAELRALAARSHSPEERDTAASMADRLAKDWRIGSALLRAYAPSGARPGPQDSILTRAGVPWWRANLANTAASLAGFAGALPWTTHEGDLVAPLLGTHTAIATAQTVYGAAALVCASHAHLAGNPCEVDEFLAGVSLSIGGHIHNEALALLKAEQGANRWALIIRPPETDQAGPVNIDARAQDPHSAFRRGIDLGQRAGLGRRALAKRPPPQPHPGIVFANAFNNAFGATWYPFVKGGV